MCWTKILLHMSDHVHPGGLVMSIVERIDGIHHFSLLSLVLSSWDESLRLWDNRVSYRSALCHHLYPLQIAQGQPGGPRALSGFDVGEAAERQKHNQWTEGGQAMHIITATLLQQSKLPTSSKQFNVHLYSKCAASLMSDPFSVPLTQKQQHKPWTPWVQPRCCSVTIGGFI